MAIEGAPLVPVRRRSVPTRSDEQLTASIDRKPDVKATARRVKPGSRFRLQWRNDISAPYLAGRRLRVDCGRSAAKVRGRMLLDD